MPSGKLIQECLVCSHTDNVGGGKSGSANAPTAMPYIMVGSEVEMPVDRTAASGTKVKADLPPHSFNVTRIDFFGTFDTDLGFVEVYAGVHDRAGPSLASLAVTNIHDSRFPANRCTK